MSAPPRIVVSDFVTGAAQAPDVAIVIDVFRACSLVCHAFAGGVRRVIPVAQIDTALALKREHPEWLIAGEREGRRLPGFDFGNSPTELGRADLAGRTLVHTTHAGTQGLVAAAASARLVLTGALVNAAATVRHALALRPGQVDVVRMGHRASERCAEDDLCAELLVAGLEDRTGPSVPGTAAVRERLRGCAAAAKFFDPAADWAPEADFDLCTEVDRFDFAVTLVRGELPYPYLVAAAGGAARQGP